ncbi:hypothetical protein MFM001_13370 [Mycobacterium sp. MFM001]|uniref:MmpS family transport accessory protein n=1 Tax=Mycobacterium sp. MFM001 TaxID=2049453 RepID=UPI000DA5A614|nr:MmpS family transport accessory protein [Mycobacterium sp. MFM001]GBE64875.1 hypothetical protein MFM001_13370 [Mycobacterium sp. MFM001]
MPSTHCVPLHRGRIFAAVLMTLATTAGISGISAANALPTLPKVRYQISGPPVAEYISYQADDGQHQEANVKLPWSKQFTAFGTEVFVISAQGPGAITCTISLDGKVVSSATAHGQPARTVCTQ